MIRLRLVDNDVSQRAGTVRRHSTPGIAVHGPGGLDVEHADRAVPPTVDTVDVVVPENIVERNVRIPALLNELDTSPFTGFVDDRPRGRRRWAWAELIRRRLAAAADRATIEARIERDDVVGAINRRDLEDLDTLGTQPDTDERALMELGDAGQPQAGVAHSDIGHQAWVLRLIRAHRLLVRETGDHPVRRLGVELHVVDVEVDLGVPAEDDGVLLLTGEGHRDAVADVAADGQRLGRFRAREKRRF